VNEEMISYSLCCIKPKQRIKSSFRSSRDDYVFCRSGIAKSRIANRSKTKTRFIRNAVPILMNVE
jgi:hypothetical protein